MNVFCTIHKIPVDECSLCVKEKMDELEKENEEKLQCLIELYISIPKKDLRITYFERRRMKSARNYGKY